MPVLGGTLLTSHGPATWSCPFTVTFPLNDALAAEIPPVPSYRSVVPSSSSAPLDPPLPQSAPVPDTTPVELTCKHWDPVPVIGSVTLPLFTTSCPVVFSVGNAFPSPASPVSFSMYCSPPPFTVLMLYPDAVLLNAVAGMHPMFPLDAPPALRHTQYCKAPAVPKNMIWLYCDALRLETPVVVDPVGPATVPPPAVYATTAYV